LRRTGDAETAAAKVEELDPTWIAERFLSDGGGYADKEADCLSMGRGKPDCWTVFQPTSKLKNTPNLIHVKSCDEQRAKITG